MDESVASLLPLLHNSPDPLDPGPFLESLRWTDSDRHLTSLLTFLLHFCVFNCGVSLPNSRKWIETSNSESSHPATHVSPLLCCWFGLTQGYDARVRVLLRRLCHYTRVPWNWFLEQEREYARALQVTLETEVSSFHLPNMVMPPSHHY